ncbi:unnamed protein product [Polarella glacialis]|uniref:Uncharacterized protein n=1 Tax=Polarella glacialis TaxID=89957 RepID=A0A813IEM7_POLGL|nr:unnamed protein product [Polarella glacialis]
MAAGSGDRRWSVRGREQEDVPRTHAGGFFRNTWRGMNDWGDEFERRHFDGDLLGSIASGPVSATRAMNDWGDDFERRHFEGDLLGSVASASSKVGEVLTETIVRAGEFPADLSEVGWIGGADFVGAPSPFSADVQDDFPPAGRLPYRDSTGCSEATSSASSRLAGEGEEPPAPREISADFVQVAGGGGSSSSQSWPRPPSTPSKNDCWPFLANDSPVSMTGFDLSPGSPGLDEAVEELKARLEEEQERRRGRTEALRAMAVSLKQLPNEILEDRRRCDVAAGSRAAAAARAAAAGRSWQTLKDNHRALLERQEAQVDERQQLVAAATASSAAYSRFKQLAGREWARDGPETDALKDSKLMLAELCLQADEARLALRKELKVLQKEVESLEAETSRLRNGGPDYYQAPQNSFRSSLRRLFSVARGRGDPQSESPK